jgi:hypothetical protein
MRSFLLDADSFWVLGALIVLAFFLVITAEAVIMVLFRLNSFKKCLSDSLMANIGSALLSILLFLVFNQAEFEGISELGELTILYFITVFFEALMIKFLNEKLSWGKILLASLVMNLLTFAVLYLRNDMGV